MRKNISNIRKCLGSHFLLYTHLTQWSDRRGGVCSDLQKAEGIVAGTEEVGKYVCPKMKNPIFIAANICFQLRANRCHCSLKWCWLVSKQRPWNAVCSFFRLVTVHIRGTLVPVEAVSSEDEGQRLKVDTETKIKHLDDWERASQ